MEILQNINRLNGFFTENRGQVESELVRYYIQGKSVWFLDGGVVFEIYDKSEVKSQESEVRSRESKNSFYSNYNKFENENPQPKKSAVLK